jgi:uncharacterized repeat protein (TIGR02543 family)
MLVIEGQSITLPESPLKGRLTFSGWYDGSDLRAAKAFVTPAGSTTYTAKWSVVVKIYDGITSAPVLTMQWDEDAVNGASISYTVKTDPDYAGKVTSVTLKYNGNSIKMEKFVDRYNPSSAGWTPYYSVFDGLLDQFTGKTYSLSQLADLLTSSSDSMALYVMWTERVRFYDNGNSLITTKYVGTGTYLSAVAVPGYSKWFDRSTSAQLNADTYRIRDSIDLGTSGQSSPANEYTIFATSYANATISPKGMIKAAYGDTVAFEYAVNAGYNAVLRIDGKTAPGSTSSGTYTFTNVTSDHSIEVLAADQPADPAAFFLTVNINGAGGVLYSTDGGVTFKEYTSPIPLYGSAEYVLKAVPDEANYFDHWSGGASGNNPNHILEADGIGNISVTANFRIEASSSFSGFGSGDLAIANLICMIVAFVAAIIGLTFAHKRNYEGTGAGKAMRFGALLIAVISVVIFILTESFTGSYVMFDRWSIVMFILLVVTVILMLLSLRHDYPDKGQGEEQEGGSDNETG